MHTALHNINVCTSRSNRSGDTIYIGPCTDVNADVSQSYNTVETLTYHTAQNCL